MDEVPVNPIAMLFRSRKFLLAMFGVIQAIVLHYLDVPRDVWLSIEALVAVLIFSIAHEDAAEKSAPVTVNAGEVKEINTPLSSVDEPVNPGL